jgi:acyl dehydratase
VRPGDRLPDLVRVMSLTDLVGYGAATWDWHRLHYDHEYASRRGLPGPVVDGQMLGALLAEQLTRAVGGPPRLLRLHFRLRAPVHVGDEVRCEATVSSLVDGVATVEQRIVAGDTVVAAPAGAELVVEPGAVAPMPPEHRRGSGTAH